MFCGKCSYTSFDHLEQCPKCGYEWSADRRVFNVDWVQEQTEPWVLSGQSSMEETGETSTEFQGYHNLREDIAASDADDRGQEAFFPRATAVDEGETEAGSSFSLDLGSELEPDIADAQRQEKPGSRSSMEEEIEFPDLEINFPGKSEK